MWSCSSPRKKTPRKNRRPAKQKTPRILPIWGRVLGVLFRYRSIWHKCAACIQRMQYTKGLGLSQQAFCNAKMAFVYTNALLAIETLPSISPSTNTKGKMAVSAKKNRKRPRLNLHSWCDPSWLWLHKEYKLTFPGWCCKLLLALANHKEGAHT